MNLEARELPWDAADSFFLILFFYFYSGAVVNLEARQLPWDAADSRGLSSGHLGLSRPKNLFWQDEDEGGSGHNTSTSASAAQVCSS